MRLRSLPRPHATPENADAQDAAPRKWGYSAPVVLFPIAFLWLVFVLLWALRQTLEPSEGPWRPWRQRKRDPGSGPHGHPARGGVRARAASRSRSGRAAARR